MKIKVIDLFCGVGGLTYGLINSGLDVVAGVDSDESCKYAYEQNNNSIFVQADIRHITYADLIDYYDGADLRVLVGCAPCQPFSKHQKGDKKNHKDWGLIYEFIRIASELKPEIISIENVPEITSEQVFKDLLEFLHINKYNSNYNIFDAANYGVPQRRRRLLLLASLLGPIEFLDVQEPVKNVIDAISGLPAISAGSKTNLSDHLHISSRLSELNLKRIRESKPGGTWQDWSLDLLPNCYRKTSGKTYTSVYGRMDWNRPAPTLTTQFNAYGSGRFGHPEQDRAISLREGAIIQSFPKEYKFIAEGEPVVIKTLARQIGNAVPPKLGSFIGKSILEHVNRNRTL